MATKSRTSNNKSNNNQKKILALVLVLLFVGLGVFLVIKSFASGSTGSPNVYNVPSTLSPGNKNTSVYALKSYLKGTTNCNTQWNDVYDATTVDCVKNFQRFFKLTVDGLVGPQTWSSLFKVYDSVIAQSGGKDLIGDGPRVISTQAAFGGALIRVYCPTGLNGARYKTITMYEQASQKTGSANCGSDGTAYVGINYNNATSLLKGQHVYEISGGPDGYGGTGPISHLTFVTMSL